VARALLPTRRIQARNVKAGHVVLVKSRAGSLRWFVVGYAVGFGKPHVWSGRWAFGGQWVMHVEHQDGYVTVKHNDDARRDVERLALAAKV